MTTYAKNISPACQGVATCAQQQKAAFDTYYLKTGQVHYFDKGKEPAKALRLDDLYGALTSLSLQFPTSMSDKNKKTAIQQGLNEYYQKKDSAAAYLLLCMNRSSQSSKNAVAWFDETQKILDGRVHVLQEALNGWKL
ncbi:hypothetical protein QQX98_000633 [Neonectria punicea]|uniref:Uncharacterized protein n=1 Tax=Neonectria punicea TaxID=979145 RepID=A0ABR1HTK7_9HYPO